MLEHTCSPAQSREGSAASCCSSPAVQTQPMSPGLSLHSTQRAPGSDLPPGTEAGPVSSQPGRSNSTSGKGWACLKGEGGAPSNGDSNRSCTNGSLITINYHFRLPSSALNHCSAFFVPPFYPTTHLPQDKGEETQNCKRSNESPCLRQDHMATRVY